MYERRVRGFHPILPYSLLPHPSRSGTLPLPTNVGSEISHETNSEKVLEIVSETVSTTSTNHGSTSQAGSSTIPIKEDPKKTLVDVRKD